MVHEDERTTDETTPDQDPVRDPVTADTDDQAPRTPVERGGALPPVDASDDVVDDASEESFPASDPPTYAQIT